MERLDKASVTRIGEIHNKLGLEPRSYIGGYKPCFPIW
jgi:hypothetical protein